jgi:HSPB1-associated protein 1
MATLRAVETWPKGKDRSDLKRHLLSVAQHPIVFKGCLDSWTAARGWSPVAVSRLLGGRETTFKVCPVRGSDEYRRRFSERETVFETQCEHVHATFLDFAGWLENAATLSRQAVSSEVDITSPHQSPPQPANPLLKYHPSQYWVYADYKYMCQLCDDRPDLIRAIDWGVLGFEGRDGVDSTLWVGSKESNTPCHYDTYGCNLVAQLWGQKKWTLFPPSDSAYLYPTRIPYEESSVFSEVNITCPDLQRHRDYASATGYQVALEAGDVLFVPRHWWHYVECVQDAVSVNTWIDLPDDLYERVKEGVVRTTVAGWLPGHTRVNHDSSQPHETTHWINPNEVGTI